MASTPHPWTGRFVLCGRGDGDWNAYITSWDTFTEAQAAFPLPDDDTRLVDTKTGVYWTPEGMFQ